MSVDFNYPYTISQDTPAVASEVQQNFAQLLAWIKTNYRQRDDTPNLTVVPTLPGPPTIAAHATTKAYVDAIVPTGVVVSYGGAAAPSGYLLCDGSSYSTTGIYANLFAVIGYSFGGAGGSFNVPNLKGRVIVGRDSAAAPFDTVGETGGQANPSLVEHTHTGDVHTHVIDHGHTATSGVQSANHTHLATHTHTASSGSGGEHGHFFTVRENMTAGGDVGEPMISNSTGTGDLRATATQPAHTHTVTVNDAVFSTGNQSADHSHTISVVAHAGSSGTASAANTGAAGTATVTNHNYPPYVVLNYIIKT